MKSILDPKFRYVDAASTDIRKTFARIRREQREEREAAAAAAERAAKVVQPIRKPTAR
jgi:hypothetical protein